MKIAKIDIQTFRGIPGRCSLDFRDKSGHACSAIIYGGNGSGKSSIVDALEFNLQGRIERNDPFKNAMRPSALSVFYKDFKQAHTSVEFVDGSVFKRDIFVLYDQLSDNFDFSIVSP